MDITNFEDIRFPVPWGHVACRWYGNRQTRPILALHGWMDNMGTWETLIPLLPPHIGIFCVDLPGHGQSSKYPTGIRYHILDFTYIIIRIVKEYRWQQVSLMGHSMGSVVNFIYAFHYPHKVDMIIAMDVFKTIYRNKEFEMKRIPLFIEKALQVDGRVNDSAFGEPPSYTYAQLKRILYEGSKKSVDLEACKFLLNRNIVKSTQYPDKYYFMRDGKTKFPEDFNASPELTKEMARRIRHVPYFIVKGTRSSYINADANPILDILRHNNKHFELHEVEGTYHVHLNNPKEVAALLNPFLKLYKPHTGDKRSTDADDEGQTEENATHVVGRMPTSKL